MQAPTFVPVLLANDLPSLDQPSPDRWVDEGFLNLLSALLLHLHQGVAGAFQEGQQMPAQAREGEPEAPALGKVLLLGLEEMGPPPSRVIVSPHDHTSHGGMGRHSQRPCLMLEAQEGDPGMGESPPPEKGTSQAMEGEAGDISESVMKGSRRGHSGLQEKAGAPVTEMELAADNERLFRPTPVRLQGGVAPSMKSVIPADGPSHETGGFMGGRGRSCDPGPIGGGALRGMAEAAALQESPQVFSSSPSAFADPHTVQHLEGWVQGEISAHMERSQALPTFRPRSPVGPGTIHSVSLTLETEHLGRIHMRVKVKGEEVGTLMLTEGLHQKRILEAGAHHLHQDLQQQGLLLRQMEVQVGGGGSGGDTGPFSAGYSSYPRGGGGDDPSPPEGQGEDDVVGSAPQPDPSGGRIHVVI